MTAGLVTPCDLVRETKAGQNADGSMIFTESHPWQAAGLMVNCRVHAIKADPKYLPGGVSVTETHTIFLPPLSGANKPQVRDKLVALGNTYTVEHVPDDSGSLHHLEVLAKLVE